MSEVAAELGADWHAINDAVMAYGQALLDADVDRVGTVEALGVDEVLFARLGRWRTQAWSTSIVDVAAGQLLDVIEGRSSAGLCEWLAAMPDAWRDAIRWAVLDLSGPWRLAFDTMLPDAAQVADPFHLVKLANQRLDEVRRRVQNETLGHRGHKDDPLYRSRRLLTKADERLDDKGRTKLLGLLDAGDPHGEVRTAWHAKETVAGIYDIDDPDLADEFVDRLGHDLQDESTVRPRSASSAAPSCAGPTRSRAWHRARVSNGPTEAANNLIKRVKRVAFGFRRFANYRIRALLYAGRPNWDLLADSHTPRLHSEFPAWRNHPSILRRAADDLGSSNRATNRRWPVECRRSCIPHARATGLGHDLQTIGEHPVREVDLQLALWNHRDRSDCSIYVTVEPCWI